MVGGCSQLKLVTFIWEKGYFVTLCDNLQGDQFPPSHFPSSHSCPPHYPPNQWIKHPSRFQPQLSWVTWPSFVQESFQSISECTKVETEYLPEIDARVAFILRKLTSWTVQRLMVFDNYDSPHTFPNIRNFIPQSELAAILVTSRHPVSNALVVNQRSYFIELFGLEEDAAVTLLIQHSHEDAKEIVERPVCQPWAVTAYVRTRKLQFCEFMDHYKRRKKVILENKPHLSQYQKRLGNAKRKHYWTCLQTENYRFSNFKQRPRKTISRQSVWLCRHLKPLINVLELSYQAYLSVKWLFCRTSSLRGRNTCGRNLIQFLAKQHFDLPLLNKQNITPHIIAQEESYQEFFISQPYIPSNQKIFDEYTNSQMWFAQKSSLAGS